MIGGNEDGRRWPDYTTIGSTTSPRPRPTLEADTSEKAPARLLKRVLVCLTLLTLPTCGDGTGPDEDPVPVDPKVFVGTWQVDIEAGEECWKSGNTYWFVIEEDDARGEVGSVQNVVSRWSRDRDFTDDDPMTGNLDHRDHRFELNLWVVILEISNRFTGTIEEGPKLVGTFRDSRSSCSTDATAVRVSSFPE